MFDRTLLIFDGIKEDARKFSYFATLISQSFFLLYYIYLICFPGRMLGAHIALLAVTAVFFAFFLFTERPKEIVAQKIRRFVRTSVRYAKYCVHLTSISLNIYIIYATPEMVSALSLVLLVFACVALILQLCGDLIGFLFRRYYEELYAAVLADTEGIRAIADKVQGGIRACRDAKEKVAAIPSRAAKIAGGIRERLSRLGRRKRAAETEEADTENENEDATV